MGENGISNRISISVVTRKPPALSVIGAQLCKPLPSLAIREGLRSHPVNVCLTEAEEAEDTRPTS